MDKIDKQTKDADRKKRLEESQTHFFVQPWNNQTHTDSYAYARVSTDKQSIENQFEDIANYCKENNIFIPLKNIYYDYAVSGSVSWTERNLKFIVEAIEKKNKPSILVVVETSRIARNSLESMEIASVLMRHMTTIHDIKNEMIFTKEEMLNDDGMLMKFFMLSLFSQIEKNTTRKRVIASLKNEKNKRFNKLDDFATTIKELKNSGLNACQITQKLLEKGLTVNKAQVYKYIENKI